MKRREFIRRKNIAIFAGTLEGMQERGGFCLQGVKHVV